MARRESEWTVGALAERNRSIVARHKSGATPKEIGKEFQITAARARRIIDGMVRLDEHMKKNTANACPDCGDDPCACRGDDGERLAGDCEVGP